MHSNRWYTIATLQKSFLAPKICSACLSKDGPNEIHYLKSVMPFRQALEFAFRLLKHTFKTDLFQCSVFQGLDCTIARVTEIPEWYESAGFFNRLGYPPNVEPARINVLSALQFLHSTLKSMTKSAHFCFGFPQRESSAVLQNVFVESIFHRLQLLFSES